MMVNDRLVDWVLGGVPVLLCLLAWHQWQPLHVPDGGSGSASNSSVSQQPIQVQPMVATTNAVVVSPFGAEPLVEVATEALEPAISPVPQLVTDPNPGKAILPSKAVLATEAIASTTPTTTPDIAKAPSANVMPKVRPEDMAKASMQPKSRAMPKPAASLNEKMVSNKIKTQVTFKKSNKNIRQTEVSQASESKKAVDQVMSDAGQEKFDRNQFSQEVKAQLARHKIYPKMAQRRRLEGRGVLELLLDGQGQLVGVRVVESTKHDILDSALLDMAQRANPYPAHGQNHVVGVTASVRFQQ